MKHDWVIIYENNEKGEIIPIILELVHEHASWRVFVAEEGDFTIQWTEPSWPPP